MAPAFALRDVLELKNSSTQGLKNGAIRNSARALCLCSSLASRVLEFLEMLHCRGASPYPKSAELMMNAPALRISAIAVVESAGLRLTPRHASSITEVRMPKLILSRAEYLTQ